jgi:acyl-CoA thioesterase-1
MRWVFLTLLILVCSPLRAEAAADRPAILVLGDSLSAGYGMALEESWVALLEARLAETGRTHRVVNASISGETTRGGLARLPRALERHRPDVVIIELGGNDGLRGLPVETVRGNLARMIELSRDAGAEVVLAGIKIPRNYGPAYAGAFEGTFPALAEQYDVALVEFFLEGVALDPELMLPDGIHPNAAAQPRLLDNVWPALEPLLEAAAGTATAP